MIMSRIIKLFEGFKEDYMRDLEAAKQQVINVKESYKSKVESYLEELKKAYDFDEYTSITKNERLDFTFSFKTNLIEGNNVKNHLFKRYKIVNMTNDVIETGDKIESELGLRVKYSCNLYYDYDNYKSHRPGGCWLSRDELKKEIKTYSKPWVNEDVIYRMVKIDLEITG